MRGNAPASALRRQLFCANSSAALRAVLPPALHPVAQVEQNIEGK